MPVPTYSPSAERDIATVVSEPERPRLRAWALAGMAALMLTFVGVQFSLKGAFLDDSYITYRYAYNLGTYGSFSYNPEDTVPTEGATSFLWVLAMIPGTLLLNDPLLYAKALSTLVALAVACSLFRRTRTVWAAALFLAWPATCIHSGTGMETMLCAGVMYLTALAFHNRRDSRLLVLACLAILARPDTMLFVATLLAWRCVENACLVCGLPGDGTSGPRRAGRAAGPVLIFALFFLTLTALRFLYFHALVPNTYYVKRSMGLVSPYSIRAIIGFAELLLPMGIAIIGATMLQWRRFRPAFLSSSWRLYIVLTAVAFFLAQYVRFEPTLNYASRFFYPCLPVVIFVTYELLRPLIRPSLQWGALTAAFLFYPAVATSGQVSDFRGVGRILQANHIPMGRALCAVPAQIPDRIVATTMAGALPYFSKWRVIDVLGLNNRDIARTGKKVREPRCPDFVAIVDVDYVFNRKPSVILDWPGDSTFSIPFRKDPRIHDYTLAARVGEGPMQDMPIDVYVRNGWSGKEILCAQLRNAGIQAVFP
jgi:hypothetical protein